MARTGENVAQELGLLPPSGVKLQRDAFGRLSLTVAGKTYEAVRPVRCYPLDAPDRYVAILDSDDQQIGLIEDVAQLSASTRQVLADELALIYLTTQVLAIRSVKSGPGLTTWEFETDRGVRQAHVTARHDVRRMLPRRVILTDATDMRFEIPDTAKLDARSTALLDGET